MDLRVEGGSQELGVGETVTLINVQAPAWHGEPLSILFQRFDVVPVLDTDASADRSLTGRLLMGATRVSDAVEFDVEQGTIITAPCGRVEVQVTYEQDPDTPVTYPRQRVIAFPYVGPRPTTTRPTRRRRLGLTNPGVRQRFPVPAYAVDVTLYCYPSIYPNLTVTTLRAPAGRDLAQWTVTGPVPVRLPAGSLFLEVITVAPAGPAVLTAEFGLCL